MEFVNHILVTESFLAKGHIHTGGKRLTNFLNGWSRPFLPMRDVTMISMDSNDKILSNEALLPMEEIVVAHELLDQGGDDIAKRLSDVPNANASMSAFYRGKYHLDIAGRIRWTSVEAEASNGSDFFVIVDPTVSGLGEKKGREFSLLKSLSYLIVNRSRPSALFLYE